MIRHRSDPVIVADAIDKPVEAVVDEGTPVVAVGRKSVVEDDVPGSDTGPLRGHEALARCATTDVDNAVIDNVVAVRAERVILEDRVIAREILSPIFEGPLVEVGDKKAWTAVTQVDFRDRPSVTNQ